MSGKRKSVFVSLEHSLEELLGLFFLRVGEEVFRSAFFDDEAVGQPFIEKAKALGAASIAKDAKAAGAALGEMKATCKECHSKFK